MPKTRYIQMFSLHGLIRSDNLELGRDADTGGQVTYVMDLARHLSSLDHVARVDLFTRLIADQAVSEDYANPLETVNDKFRIVRIQCGGRKYLRKELLWPHLDEFVDKTVKFIKREQALPDIVHGHYPDAGYVAMELARFFGVPFIFTGHSLGRVKKQKLLKDGIRAVDLNRRYKIDQRIAVEEELLDQADLVVTSTHQEIREQYGLYENKERPDFAVMPPGLDVERFYPYYRDQLSQGNDKDEAAQFARASVLRELNRFFRAPDKPLILALCRPDKRKNISGLVRAYGEDLDLQAMANLAVFAGIRKDIESMEDNEREVLTEMLLRLDRYDLYGKMAIPKKHDFASEVPELYRIAAEKRGVFVNPALTEPFGITLLEASATGLPFVATKDGGPKDIVANCQNGILVNPSEPARIAGAVKTLIADRDKWDAFSKNGIMNVRQHYTWESHARRYMEKIEKLVAAATAESKTEGPPDAIGRRLTRLSALFVTDIDHTLVGEDNAKLPALLEALKSHRAQVGFVVATGRTIASASDHLKAHGVDDVDVLITSVGAEIYYGPRLQPSRSWEAHIAAKWEPAKIRRALKDLRYLTDQEDETQRPFKISYYMAPGKDRLAEIHNRLRRNKCRFNLVYSHDQYLDILPYRASKGKAIRFLSYKWEIPLGNVVVAGDSGNDEEMLRGEPLAIVVANYRPELDVLRRSKRVYFAEQPCAGGILEGLQKYRFFEKTKADQ